MALRWMMSQRVSRTSQSQYTTMECYILYFTVSFMQTILFWYYPYTDVCQHSNTQYLYESCERQKSQVYYSGWIRTHDLCSSRAIYFTNYRPSRLPDRWRQFESYTVANIYCAICYWRNFLLRFSSIQCILIFHVDKTMYIQLKTN